MSNNTTVYQIAARLAAPYDKQPVKSGDGYTSHCPCHDDQNGSFTVSMKEDKILGCCQVGCPQAEVWAAIAPLVPKDSAKNNGKQIKEIYQYRDIDNKVVIEKIRYIPKGFALRKPDGSYKNATKNVDTSILYNLPEVIQASADGECVYLVEGEKDCDSLAGIGLIATTNLFGASENGKKPKWTNAHAKWLKGTCEVVILPDNDSAGKAHASAMANSVSSLGILCKIVELPGLPNKGDISDWLQLPDNNKEKLLELVASTPFFEVTKVTEVTEPESVTGTQSQDSDGVTTALPQEKKVVTAFTWNDGKFELTESGVSYIITAKDDKPEHKPEQRTEICSYLRVIAKCDDYEGDNWGILLEFKDGRGRLHNWTMPAELHKGSGEEYRGELLRQGVKIYPGTRARVLLGTYLQVCEPKQLAKSVNKSGWSDNKFVLPDGRIIGQQSNELLLLQTMTPIKHGVKTKGDLQSWKNTVARYAQGNSRLVFGISLAFSVPLLELLGEESGGFNLRGKSSLGKTTILCGVASTFGSKEFVKSCRATINGLEGIAAAHTGLPLLLDEIGQLNPQEVIELIYMLANGRGKGRANKYGAARTAYTWQLLYLLSGEKSLGEHAAKVGGKSTAGTEVRLIDIAADTGKYGAFENIHGFKDAVEFVSELKQSATANHGTAGPAFIENVSTASIDQLQTDWKNYLNDFLTQHVSNGASGQVKRVAQRFALVAFAGEMATGWGITGWQEGTAQEAAITLFKQWLNERGGAEEHERTAVLEQVKLFFELHGNSRFEDEIHSDFKINQRAGRREVSGDCVDYYVLPEVFNQEVIKGLNKNYCLSVLKFNEDMRLITYDDNGRQINQTTKRIGSVPTKVYHIRIAAAKEGLSNEAV
jgi:putative DNA primase/helicase